MAHISKGGKVKCEADLELPEGHAITNLAHGQAYRYLGIRAGVPKGTVISHQSTSLYFHLIFIAY